MKGVKKRRRYSRTPVQAIRPGFTDFGAAIEEAEYLYEQSGFAQHYAVVQNGPVLRVVQHRSALRHAWATLAAKQTAEWLKFRELENLLRGEPENCNLITESADSGVVQS